MAAKSCSVVVMSGSKRTVAVPSMDEALAVAPNFGASVNAHAIFQCAEQV
ncbi:MAG: hypothetical protein ACOH13_08090 [Flavobacteriales bacterium]